MGPARANEFLKKEQARIRILIKPVLFPVQGKNLETPAQPFQLGIHFHVGHL